MENIRFTLFNGITLFIMALTAAMAVARGRRAAWGPWPALYYLAVAGFAIAFPYSLNLYGVLAGIGCALLVRAGLFGRAPRIAEYGVLAYIFGRSFALIMMW